MARLFSNAHLLRDLRSLNRSQIAPVRAARNVLAAVVPLAGGALTGHLDAGITIFIGALNVAASDVLGPYRLRLRWMLLASVGGALSVLVGASAAAYPPVVIALMALWGFWGGLLVALGPGPTQIGLTSIVLLLVFGARPLSLPDAVGEATLVLAGGLLQTLLAVLTWPVHRFRPQRQALAAVFRQLAVLAATPPDPAGAPAATAQISDARASLAAMGGGHGPIAEALRTLLDEAERIRLELVALHDVLAAMPAGDASGREVDAALAGTATLLSRLADALVRGRAPAESQTLLRQVEEVATRLQRPSMSAGPAGSVVAARVVALSGQLRAVMESAAGESAEDERAGDPRERSRPPRLRLREPLATLRSNLTLRSPACRHAVRLACSLVVASIVVHAFALPRAYWLPLTMTLVLKPDFTSTFARGAARVAGTLVGLLLATALVHVLFGTMAAEIALAGLLMFLMRSVGLANYAILTAVVTALVVTLTALTGASPASTILERGVYSLAGGLLALLAYAAWPTWERTQAPGALADLIESYRRYAGLVAAALINPARGDRSALDAARQDARLARTNAEASVDRLRGEPVRSEDELDRADGLLASSHRLAHSIMGLESSLYDTADVPAPDAFEPFARDLDATLRAAVCVLRNPSDLPDSLPDLRADQRSLAAACAAQAARGESAGRATILADETDRIADSVNTMLRLLSAGHDGKAARSPAHQ